jgi:hypothetical protein
MASSGSCARAPRGATCRSGTVPGRRAMTGSSAGAAKGYGSGCSRPSRAGPMRRGSWSGPWWGSTAPVSARISTRPAPAASPRRLMGKKGEALLACEALGRSRGGFTTKLHLAVDGRGRPLAVRVTEGQRHESTQLAALLESIRVPRPRGRPRTRPSAATSGSAARRKDDRAAGRRASRPPSTGCGVGPSGASIA